MLIPKSVFELHRVCDPDLERYALDGIQFSRRSDTDNPCAVATDGRCLIAATWKEPSWAKSSAEFAEVIPREYCQRTLEFGGIKSSIKLGESLSANGNLPITGADPEVTDRIDARPSEGRFPKWRDIFPHYDDPVQINLDLEFLANLAATMAAATKNSDSDVKVTLTVDRQAAPKDADSGPVTLIARTEDGLTIAGVLSSTPGDPVTWNAK